MNLENISIKQIAAVISSIGVIVGAGFTIDSRYAKEQDLKDEITNLRKALVYSIDNLHKNILENEQLRIEMDNMKNKSEANRILLERYKRDLEVVNQRMLRNDLRLKSIVVPTDRIIEETPVVEETPSE